LASRSLHLTPMEAAHYRTILASVDFSALSQLALETAARVAELAGSERLHLVHVRRRADALAPAHVDYVTAEAEQRRIEDFEAALAQVEVPAVRARITREVRSGNPAEEIARAAQAVGADLVVSGTHGRSPFVRFMLGSVANNLIRISASPVLIVGEERRHLDTVKKIVAAIDLSRTARSVLHHAVALARAANATVEVVSIYDFPMVLEGSAHDGRDARILFGADEHRRAVQALVDEVQRTTFVDVRLRLFEGLPSKILIQLTEEQRPDVLAIGTSGHGPVQRAILGSTATKVAARAACPVLVVPRPHSH
jgi:nucleotide-binding universal stress UspA family protein